MSDPLIVVEKFNAAWNAHDLAGALELTSADCVFESTAPAPDGVRSIGRDSVAAAWRPIFTDTASGFSTEDVFVAGDRVVQRLRYDVKG